MHSESHCSGYLTPNPFSIIDRFECSITPRTPKVAEYIRQLTDSNNDGANAWILTQIVSVWPRRWVDIPGEYVFRILNSTFFQKRKYDWSVCNVINWCYLSCFVRFRRLRHPDIHPLVRMFRMSWILIHHDTTYARGKLPNKSSME